MGVFKKHEDLDQGLLFPPSPRDWLPEGHLAWFLSDTVDELDLDAFPSRYRMCGKGEQAYPPRVMPKILLYAYSVGDWQTPATRSEDNLRHLKEQGIHGYVAVGREGKAEPEVRPHLVKTRAMQKKLRTARGRATHKKRKYLVEPVFGWIKQVLGFRQFSLRGLAKVRAEWELACAAVNLRRMGARLEWR